MPIQITQNIRTKKGVANGTMGHLHSVRFPLSTGFTRAIDERTGVVVAIPDKRPLYALAALDRGDDVAPLAVGSLFPVFPDCEAFQNATIPLIKSQTGETRSLTV
jgi:hypothetical protein